MAITYNRSTLTTSKQTKGGTMSEWLHAFKLSTEFRNGTD